MLKITPKLASTFFVATLVVGVFGVPKPAVAVVAFNTFPISYTRETNKDFPMIDAKNVTRGGSLSTSQADHDNGVQADPGDEIEFQIYYHNTGVPEDIATNVIIKATLPGGTRQSHEVSATIDSDQTNPITSSSLFFGGNIAIQISGGPQTLEFIPGTTHHFPNRSTTSQTVAGGDNIISSGVNIGSIRGCFEFSGFVTFRARIGGQVSTTDRNLSITKKVLNVTKGETTFGDSTTASPSDRLRFEVRFETTGNASQTGVIARDILPGGLNFVPGTLQIDGSGVANEIEFFASGRNFGTLGAGTSRRITFEANVAAAGAFSTTITLTNTANVRSDQVSTRQEDAGVSVHVVGGIQFSLRKTAFNLTKGVEASSVAADSGDILTYTLYYKNTGGLQINNVVIEDDIRDILELTEITNQGGAVSVNSTIKFAALNVPAGVEITRTFQVKVRNAELFPASSDLVMVNLYGNEVRVVVRKPQARGVVSPPRTGLGEWTILTFALLTTAAYWFYRRTRVKSTF